jgi:hypothetical protein
MNLSSSKDSAGSSMLPLLRSLNGMEGCKYSVEALGSALSRGWSQKGIILPHLLHLCKSVNPTSNLCQQQTFTASVHQDLNITSSFCICMTHYTSSCYSHQVFELSCCSQRTTILEAEGNWTLLSCSFHSLLTMLAAMKTLTPYATRSMGGRHLSMDVYITPGQCLDRDSGGGGNIPRHTIYFTSS